MKLTSLLTQYLYSQHRLDLPGIGTFTVDPSSMADLENSKQRTVTLDGISFESNPGLKESPDLIAYISAQTGKMKALASADLESYLELAQQFLNIGKPYTFDGIGTIIKVKQGEFEFVPTNITTDKVKAYNNPKEPTRASVSEEVTAQYESFLNKPKTSQAWKKPVIAVLVVAGLGLAIWGGYMLSKKNTVETESTVAQTEEEKTVPVTTAPTSDITATTIKDTVAATTPANSTTVSQPVASLAGNYKYILEIANQPRAFKRYSQLKTNQWNVQLETKDSVQYKLFLLLPAANADTTRILDSLTVMTGRRVYIEHHN